MNEAEAADEARIAAGNEVDMVYFSSAVVAL